MATFLRPALGDKVLIGTLYDMRSNLFLSEPLFKQHLPEDAQPVTKLSDLTVQAIYKDTHRNRCELMTMPVEIAADIFTRNIHFGGAIEGLRSQDIAHSGQIPRLDAQASAEITIYSEMCEEDHGILMADLQEACDFLGLVPLHVKSAMGEKGWPITYELLPIDALRFFLNLSLPNAAPALLPSFDLLKSCIVLIDEYVDSERELKSQQANVLSNRDYLPPDTQRQLENQMQKLQHAKASYLREFAQTMLSVKSGSTDPDNLRRLLEKYRQGDNSPAALSKLAVGHSEALNFIHIASSLGAQYVGHNGVRLPDVMHTTSRRKGDTYIFLFTPAMVKDAQTWQANSELLMELLQNDKSDALVFVVDCAAISKPLDKPRIERYQAGTLVTEDLLETRHFMAMKSFAVCPEQTLESKDIKPPVSRRHVTILCPGTKCSVAKVCEWLCPRCTAPIEYGFTDQYIYCDCGRSLYGNYEFRCNADAHGSQYTAYQGDVLLRLLNNLKQSNYVNILILGETGVGKSTFINAMVNYLEFESLDEAVEAEKLNYVIPCSFSTQIMDRLDPNKPIEQKHIKIGARDDEHDGGKGDAATQKTTVYPVTFESGESTLTVRLIDTPGMGDTRGVDFDRKNIADILSTLSAYDELHGVLILLKCNVARLTPTFRYCMKELLTHLHNKAAANMVFGFTNTRITNYTPGDTYGPLQTLFSQLPDVGLSLTTPTTYCFDSESFRYLAAHKMGVTMPNKLDFDRSWEQSRDETIRLIHHFQSISPHEVKNTMSLNGARQLISELTKPLAEISQTINTNTRLVEDHMNELKDTRLRGDALRNSLHVQKVHMNAEPLSMPRTVCSHKSCIEVRDDGKGQNNMVIQYKTHCHPVCYLDDVQADVQAYPGLIHCAAFSGRKDCGVCSHHWQEHLHVLYELYPETVTVIDAGIQEQLTNHASDLVLREAAIKQHEELVDEYKQEREIIRDAAAKFCVFLKNKSLVPYNDALIAYLDFLIKEEQAKVQAGGNDKRLMSLTEERHKHQEAIEVITRNMHSGAAWTDFDEGSVDRMVQSLYSLKHFGENLKNMKQGISTAHQSTYRERPYNVKRRNQTRYRRVVEVVPARPESSRRHGRYGGPYQSSGYLCPLLNNAETFPA